MRTRNPDARFLAVRAMPAPPEEGLERALWELLRGVREDKVVSYAHEVYEKVSEREVLQAWFVARAEDAVITEVLRIPADVLAAYRHLFFDLSLFRDELDLVSWVSEYATERRGTPFGAQLLQQAMNCGVDALLWIYGRGQYVVDPHKVQQQAMTDAFVRGRSHRGHDLSGSQARAAMACLKLGASLAEKLAQRNGGAGLGDLLIKLRHRDLTSPREEIPQSDLLH